MSQPALHPRILIGVLAALAMIGAISIDTYLPAMPTIAAEFSISSSAVQQSLSVFVFGFALMTLFYGTLSDSFGRRPVIIITLVLYLAASIGCAFATSLTWLLLFRFVQGLSGAAGNVVGRAMIGDLFTGAEAQRMMSFVSMVFGLAPAIAPILGGWLQSEFGWRSIFYFISTFSFVLLVICLRILPESLETSRRHPFHFKLIIANYWRVGGHLRFLSLCLGNALTFCCVSIYIGAASAFIYTMLHLSQREFGWLFIPLVGGMTLGSMLSARMSHRLTPQTIIRLGYALMFVSAIANVAYNYFFSPSVPWAVIPPFFYCLGMSFAAPAMAMQMLGMFPKVRGMVSSLMSFVFMFIFAIITGVVCPFIFDTALHLALSIFAGLLLSMLFWWLGAPSTGDNLPAPHVESPEEVPLEI